MNEDGSRSGNELEELNPKEILDLKEISKSVVLPEEMPAFYRDQDGYKYRKKGVYANKKGLTKITYVCCKRKCETSISYIWEKQFFQNSKKFGHVCNLQEHKDEFKSIIPNDIQAEVEEMIKKVDSILKM